MEHLAVGVAEGKGLHQLRTLSPWACGTVDVVVGIPVIDHLAKFAGEHTFVFRPVALADVVGPVVHHIVVVSHSCRLHVGNGYRTAWIGKLFAGDV